MNQKGDAQGRVIVLGNEKGGTGKSTTAMHLVVALMRNGHDVGTVDLDSHQGTLSRYVENRKTFSDLKNMNLLLPDHKLFRYPSSGDVADTLYSVDHLVTALRALPMQLSWMSFAGPARSAWKRFHAARDRLISWIMILYPSKPPAATFPAWALAIIRRFCKPMRYRRHRD